MKGKYKAFNGFVSGKDLRPGEGLGVCGVQNR